MKDLSKVLLEIQEAGIPLEKDHSLAKYNSYRIGGDAKIFAKPNKVRQLIHLQKIVNQFKVPYFLLGGGSNILISDHSYEGIVIYLSLEEKIKILEQKKDSISFRVPANARVPWFAKKISQMGYKGIEFLTTIPGQLGGVVVQNAGCYGSEVSDFIQKVHAIKDAKIIEYDAKESDFSYRNSLFKKEKSNWIFSADFYLKKGNLKEIMNNIETYRQHRLNSQPRNRKSAGSIFKNPDKKVSKLKAWELIHKAGLANKQIGDAIISPSHCNFIVNLGSAKAEDIHQLISLAEKTVQDKLGVSLEREVIMVGKFDLK